MLSNQCVFIFHRSDCICFSQLMPSNDLSKSKALMRIRLIFQWHGPLCFVSISISVMPGTVIPLPSSERHR